MNGDFDGVLAQQIDDNKGRGLFATRDFLKGETLFREKPAVCSQFSWNQAYGYQACHHCLEPLETANENVVRLSNDANIVLPFHEFCATRPAFHVKCPNCEAARYCSDKCLKDSFDQYHKTLCHTDPNHPLAVLDDLWRSMHHPPETSSIMLICRILANVIQSEDPMGRINEYMTLMHDTANVKDSLVHKILGESYSEQLEQLRMATANVFAAYPVVSGLLTPEGFSSLVALIGRNGQGIGTSAFAVWVREVEKKMERMDTKEKSHADGLIDAVYKAIDGHAGPFMNNEGSGLYLLQSTINHSCQPNAAIEFPFNSSELVVNALKRIEAGEEILISYLNDCDLERSRHSRLRILANNYLFVCDCPKCAAEKDTDPGVTSDEEMTTDDEEDEED